MSNVQVAIRVRPLNARETTDGRRIAVQVEDKIVTIRNVKLEGRPDGHMDSREKVTEFGFDYCYWSVDPDDPNYASQEEVFQDLGVSVLTGASEGYNVCLFAYGQTGSGKTYTMMGTPASVGLTPRICQGLFGTDDSSAETQGSSRVEISFLEIYNERVRDLLKPSEQKKPPHLRVREHPEKGPYVQGLSQYVVTDYKQAVDLLEAGIANRITAATHVHDASSRSHAIFTIQYTQAILENNLPSEIVSKINLVDLAGSERADPHYCRDRITEGSNINKSLVTLGIVISALAQNSQMCNSCQSINSVVSEGEGSTGGSQSSGHSAGPRRQCFIPYRDSVLTWLLKDSLGGNSKTVMIATVSPSCSSYNETLSTLRYAAHARNIVNKPRVNEDANVQLIRELREEIDRLKSMLLSFKMRNPSPALSEDRDGNLSDIILQNELKVEQLTKDWSESWQDKKELLEQYSVDIDRDRAGFLIRSLLPHLIALDRDVLSTGVTFYHLREGVTKIGPQDVQDEPQIVLQGEARCEIVNQRGVVTLKPVPGSVCIVNGREVTEPCRLAQGAVITLGEIHKFRFNHPEEAAILRERRRANEGELTCGSADLSFLTPEHRVEGEGFWERGGARKGTVPRQRVEEQQRYVETLRDEIQAEQQEAEQELEREQADLRQRHRDIQQWVLQEKQRLSAKETRATGESGVQTDPPPVTRPQCLALGFSGGGMGDATVGDRKRVVQEELLRHHALRRAESRVRRKRLHYQLQRVARKRHLLEAKRELQRLESALSPDSPTSSETDSPLSTAGASSFLRRHSFSADLLLRLYPNRAPTFSNFLRRNRSLEFSSSWRTAGPQKWISDECLPSRRMRGRANTLPSGSRSFEVHANSLENMSAGAARVRGEMTKEILSNNRATLNRRKKEVAQNAGSSERNGKDVVKMVPSVGKPSTTCSSPKRSKPSPRSSKGLERLRKVFSPSAGPAFRTALSKLFRKPPSGPGPRSSASNSKVAAKSGNKTEDRSVLLYAQTEKRPLKVALSCDDLEQNAFSEEAEPKSWHSEGALARGGTAQPALLGWTENRRGKDREGSSDGESSFSVDSLSSAYAAALTEQLRREESNCSSNESEAESVDSQISQDSLAAESNSEESTVRPKSKQPLSSSFCAQAKRKKLLAEDNGAGAFSHCGSLTSDEMPAEVYWRRQSSSSPKQANKPETKWQLVREMQMEREANTQTELKAAEEPEEFPLPERSCPFSCPSVREPESLLVLTDAWSSTEPSDSPRMHSEPSVVGQLTQSHAVHSISSLQSSVELSDDSSESENKPFYIGDSTGRGDATLTQKKYWDTEMSTDDDSLMAGMLGDKGDTIVETMDTITMVKSMNCQVWDFGEGSEIGTGVEDAQETIKLEEPDIKMDDNVKESVSSGTEHCTSPSFPPMEYVTFNNAQPLHTDKSSKQCHEGDCVSLSMISDLDCPGENTCWSSNEESMNTDDAAKKEQLVLKGSQVDDCVVPLEYQPLNITQCDTDTHGDATRTADAMMSKSLLPKEQDKGLEKPDIGLNEDSASIPGEMSYSGIIKQNLLEKSGIKHSDRSSYLFQRNTVEEVEGIGKEGRILPLCLQDSEDMLEESQRTYQASLRTQTDFKCKRHDVSCEIQKETLEMKNLADPKLEEDDIEVNFGNFMSDIATVPYQSELNLQTDAEGTREESYSRSTKVNSVKKVCKSYKSDQRVNYLKYNVNQKASSFTVGRSAKYLHGRELYRGKRKYKLCFAYNKSKNLQKNKADKKVEVPTSSTENPEIRECFSKELPICVTLHGYEGTFILEKEEKSSKENSASSFILVSEPSNDVKSTVQQIHKHFPGMETINKSILDNSLNMCRTFVSPGSVDVLLVENAGDLLSPTRENMDLNQKSTIQEENGGLLEYLSPNGTKETAQSPVDQKITEVVKEHMKLNPRECEETSSNDELDCKEMTTELSMHKYKNISLHEGPVTSCGVESTGNKMKTLNSKNKAGLEQNLMSDVTQNNSSSEAGQTSLGREMGIMSFENMYSVQVGNDDHLNSGASLDTKEHESSGMVTIDKKQEMLEANKKDQSHTNLSNDVNCPEDVISVLENQPVKNVDAMDCSSHREIEMEAATAEHQLLLLNTCEIGSAYLIRSQQMNLETVDKPGAERNSEVHATHSTPCQFKSCKECDLSKQVHLSDPVVQTELNNVENIYISSEGSSISQVREDKRHDPVPNEGDASSENWRGAHLKVSRSTSDDLGVLTRSCGQAFRPNASPSNGNPSLSTSVKITEPKMNFTNTHENVSRDVDPDNVNTIISQECNLNSFQLQSEQFLQNVTLDHSWPTNDVDLVNTMCQDQCTDEAKFALGKDRSGEENRFCHLSSFTHLTKTSKHGQTKGPLTNSGKKGVEQPLQKGPLKSENSTENARKTYKVSSDPSVLQNDNGVQTGILQMCDEGDSTQCNVCVEGCSDGKTPSNIVPTGAVNDSNNKDLIEIDVAFNAEIAHNTFKGMSVAEKAIMISSTSEKHPEMDFLTDGVSQALTETPRTSASSVVNIRSEKDHCDAATSRKWHGHKGSHNAVHNSSHPTKETVDSFHCQTGQSVNGFSATTCVKPKDTRHYLGERDNSRSNSAVVLQGTAESNKALSLSSPLQTFQHSHVSCTHTTSCSFTDTLNSTVSPQKIKPKRLKRSNAKASPTSTSDSAVDSSPEEVTSKVHPARSILKQSRVRANIQHKQEAAVKSSGAGFIDLRHKSLTPSPVSMSSIKDTDSLKHFRGTHNKTSSPLCTETNCKNDNKTRGEGKCVQEESNTTNHLKEKVQVLESDNCAQAGILNGAHSYARKQLQQHAATPAEQVVPLVPNQQNLCKNDSTMHFASSDINPFVHPWQDVSREKYKQAFGSATDISCKSDSGSNHVIRCCSVDDGLNVTNSPFHAHLSALACNKKLSSTLSSIEGYKEQASSECQYPSSHSQREHQGTGDSYCSDISGDQCNGSCQVDEIMLVCSSDQESSAATHNNCYTLNCNHSTQTNVEGRQKKKRLHRRNKTQVQRTEDREVPTMWRSLQNMSLHLSQLLHNTSGFLGNIQCIEAKKTDNYAINNDVSPSINCSKRDSSTQTSVDIAIQTDRNTKLLSNTNTLPGCLEGTTEEALKPHEVNVIVKVIGTDMLSMSQEKGDMTLTLQDRILTKNPSQKMLSMPDLHVGSHPKKSQSSTETVPLRAQSSASSPDTDIHKYSHFRSDTSLVFPSSYTAEPAFTSGLAVTRTNNNSLQTPRLKNLTLRKGGACHHSAKDVYYVDRASSPILTVEAGAATQMVKNKSSQCLLDCQNAELKPVKDLLWKKRNSQTASTYRFRAKKQERFPFEKTKMSEQGHQHIDQLGEIYGNRATRFSFDNVSKLSHSYSEESEGYTVNSEPFKRKTFHSNTGERVKGQMGHIGFSDSNSPTMKSNIQSPRLCYMHSSTKDQHHSSLISRYKSGSPPLDCRQEENTSRTSKETFIIDKDLSFNNQSLENYYREANDMRQCFSSPDSFEISEGTLQLQEDDAMSLAPSECNTDILVNIQPSVEQTETEHQRVPEDLPMHNKFTSWSGVGYQPPSNMSSGLAHLPSSAQNTKDCQPGQDHSEGTKGESTVLSSNRLKEIERLRQEREQVLAAVRLDMNHQQLTVELTEAKLHYGQGETDAMLKMLKSGSVEDPNGVPSKQELYDRHRRSIESLRQEREAQLQTCRRARSLSPSKHGVSPRKGPALPVRATELPSQRRDYLQKLRQAVVSSTSRVTTPLRLTGERPSEIELLLQDYGRAREEARTEIARARDRLRERAEQEKRRLQQQVLSQLVKDDLRLRTRASSSTLCTGSSLSLSSGPTSGYNSSNTVLLKEGNSPSEAPQVRGQPPVHASHRPWLSAQDVRVEATVHRSDPLDPSSLAPQGRQRTLSLSSTSSVSKSYQDIAASALASATAEMYSAAGGDLENLLLGRASGAWRYHGAERGVRAYHKPSSSPSVHSFLGAAELERPLHSLWCMVRDHSKAHLYNGSVRSAWTQPVDCNLQLAYLLTNTSSCCLCQPLDFCCISAESRQEGQWTLAVRSVQEDSLPPPGAEVVRGELLPSAWLLQPRQREGRDVVWVFYLLQVDLRTPAHSQRLLNSITRQHAAVIAELDAFFSL